MARPRDYHTKDSQIQRADLWLQRGRRERGELDWEFGVSRRKPVYIGWINNKVLLYRTGSYIQYSVINHNGKEQKLDSLPLFLFILMFSFLFWSSRPFVIIPILLKELPLAIPYGQFKIKQIIGFSLTLLLFNFWGTFFCHTRNLELAVLFLQYFTEILCHFHGFR